MKRAMIVVLFFTLLFGAGVKEVAASGQAWAVIDADTGRLLEGQNENVRLPIASLTKIWTAFTFIESGTEPGDVHHFSTSCFSRRFVPLFAARDEYWSQMPCLLV